MIKMICIINLFFNTYSGMNLPKTEIEEKIRQMYPGISKIEIKKMMTNEELIKIILEDSFFKENFEENSVIDNYEEENKDSQLREDDFDEDILTIKEKILTAKNLLKELKIEEISSGYQKEYKIYNIDWDYIGYINLKFSDTHMEISDLWTSNLVWGLDDVNERLRQEAEKMSNFEEKWLGTAILLYTFTKIAKKYNIETFSIVSAKHADDFYKKVLHRFEEIGLIQLNSEGGENFFSGEILDEVEL